MEKVSSTALFVLIVAACCTIASAGLMLPWGEQNAAKSPPKNEPRTVRCRHRNFPKCFMVPHLCPKECLSTCLVDCRTCKPACSMSILHVQHTHTDKSHIYNALEILSCSILYKMFLIYYFFSYLC